MIIVQSICPNYELQTIREQKRFLCDTFSRKQNVELLLYDQDKNKYRLYWNENYGAFDETLMADNHEISILIRYFKRSKIVFSCNKIGEAIHEHNRARLDFLFYFLYHESIIRHGFSPCTPRQMRAGDFSFYAKAVRRNSPHGFCIRVMCRALRACS